MEFFTVTRLVNSSFTNEETQLINSFKTKYDFDIELFRKIIRNKKNLNEKFINLNKFNNTQLLNKNNKISDMIEKLKKLNELYNLCILRNNEGDFIRNTLVQLTSHVQKKFKFSTNPKNAYCVNQNLFGNKKKLINITEDDDDSTFTQILNQLFSKLENTVLIIVNLINVSDSITENNPSTIPFIDLNDLEFFYQYYKDYEKKSFLDIKTIIKHNLFIEFQKLKNKLLKYNYYKKIIGTELQIVEDQENIIESIENILMIVNTNNSSTLIGSLNFIELLSNQFDNKNTCTLKKNDDLSESFYDYRSLTENLNDPLVDSFKDKQQRLIKDILEKFNLESKLSISESNRPPFITMTKRPASVPASASKDISLGTGRSSSLIPHRNKYLKYKIKYYKLKTLVQENNI